MLTTIVAMATIIMNQTAHAMCAKPIVKDVLVLLFVLIVSTAFIWQETHAFSAILTVGYAQNMVLVLLLSVTMTHLTTSVPLAFLSTMTEHVLRAILTA